MFPGGGGAGGGEAIRGDRSPRRPEEDVCCESFPPDALYLAKLKYSHATSADGSYSQSPENQNKLIFTHIKTQIKPWQVINFPFLGQRCLSPGEHPH